MERGLGSRLTIATARDGVEALELFEKGEFYDLVISDIRMPRLDGLELLRYHQQHPSCRRFILATGGGLSAETQEFLKTSDIAVLTKPYSAEDILRIVKAPAYVE
jgi:CheY-like chemotaxis protein